MTESGIIAVVGIGATFIGTLVGGIVATILANAHSARQNRELRTFAMKDAARGLVVTILTEARAWLSVASSTAMVLGTASSLNEVDNYLKSEWTDSWTGKQYREHSESLLRAITEARLLIADPPLRAAIVELGTLQGEWWDSVISPIRSNFKTGVTDQADRIRPLWKWEARFKYGTDLIERLATDAIATSLKS